MSRLTAYEDEPLIDFQARLKAEKDTASKSPPGIFDDRASDASVHAATENQSTYSPRPLIDQISNRWRDDEKSTTDHVVDVDEHNDDLAHFCSIDDESSCPSTAHSLLSSRRGRRMLAYFLALALLGFYLWRWHLQPAYVEDWVLREGFLRQENGTEETFGIAKGGDFAHGKTKILKLDESLIPGGREDSHGKRRLIFVGDIHGCNDELLELLHEVSFDEKHDHLIATGDVISKGPDSPGVLDTLIHLNATSVRGNHEDRILASASTVLALSDSELETYGGNKWARKDAKLLKHLHNRHLRYLHSMPLVLRIPALPQARNPSSKKTSPLAEEILVVHAGLVPAIPLEKQDPYFVMNMRSLHPHSHVPSSEHANKHKKNGRHNKPWIDVWNYYNNHLFRNRSIKGFRGFDVKAQRGEDADGWVGKVWQSVDEWRFWGSGFQSASRPKPQVVVYGHDSKSGLSVRRWTKGLDSGCVTGGRLTAMVLNARGKTEIVSVPCKAHY